MKPLNILFELRKLLCEQTKDLYVHVEADLWT